MLWAKLKKRNVVRVSLAYTAVSWVALQFAQIIFDALVFPPWSMRVFLVALAAGFLVAVVIAWAYQVIPEASSSGKTAGEPRTHRLNQLVDLSIIAVLAIGVSLLAYRQFINKPVFMDSGSPVEDVSFVAPDEYSVAVLRFTNLGGDQRFSDGLSENLLHLLARLKEIKVPSRTTTWKLSDENIGSKEIASHLSVRYILEGSVQKEDDQIRVVAQLIDGTSGDHVWSESYDHTLTADTYFSTQDDIAAKVVGQIQATLSTESEQYIGRERTGNLQALEHYLKGREYLRAQKTEDNLAGAVAEFDAAFQIDLNYAEAMAGLCEANLAYYVSTRNEDYFVDAERSCLRAATMDDTLAEVYAAMGSLYRYAGRYDEAQMYLIKSLDLIPDSVASLEELGRAYRAGNKLVLAETTFQKAVVIEPSNWSVYKSMGAFLFRTGRYEEALPYFRQVITLQPENTAGYNNLAVTNFMQGRFDEANTAWHHIIEDSPTRLTYVNYANSLYYSRKYEESVSIYRRALDMDDSDHRVWQGVASSLRHIAGQEKTSAEAFQRAIETAQVSLTVNPDDSETLSQIAVSYARAGNDQLAQQSIDRVVAVGWENPNTSFFVALAYRLLGNDDEAIQVLERAVVMGFPRALIAWEPDFQSLNSNKRYMALLELGQPKPGS
jgi:TolB-like protein/Flp pilus assembly protein TadD